MSLMVNREPKYAISIRQPWAWLIIHGGKDVENRTWPTAKRGPIFIHAASGLTRQEWEVCWEFVNRFDRALATKIPRPEALEKGGIIGQADLTGCVREAFYSQWYAGGSSWAHVLSDPKPLPFRPCRGQLNYFIPEFPAA